jgi:hypothetical protein
VEEILKFVEFNQYNLPFIIQILGLYLIMLYLALVAWVAKDITTRSQSFPVILTTVFFVLVGNIPALVIYLLVRPDATLDESKAQNLFQSSILDRKVTNCGECGCLVRTDFKYCPSCSSEVNHRCKECDHIINPTWRYCSFCNYRLVPEPWHIIWPQAARKRIGAVSASFVGFFKRSNENKLKKSIENKNKQNNKKIEKKADVKPRFKIRLPKIAFPKIAFPKVGIPRLKLPQVKIRLPKLKINLFNRKPKAAKLSIMAEKKHPVKLEKKFIVGQMSKGKATEKSKTSSAPKAVVIKPKKSSGRGRPKGLKDNKPRKKRADAGRKRGNYKK